MPSHLESASAVALTFRGADGTRACTWRRHADGVRGSARPSLSPILHTLSSSMGRQRATVSAGAAIADGRGKRYKTLGLKIHRMSDWATLPTERADARRMPPRLRGEIAKLHVRRSRHRRAATPRRCGSLRRSLERAAAGAVLRRYLNRRCLTAFASRRLMRYRSRLRRRVHHGSTPWGSSGGRAAERVHVIEWICRLSKRRSSSATTTLPPHAAERAARALGAARLSRNRKRLMQYLGSRREGVRLDRVPSATSRTQRDAADRHRSIEAVIGC
jgi:hypothetical protein